MNLQLFFGNIAQAKLVATGPETNLDVNYEASFGVLVILLKYASVLFFVIGALMLISTLVQYLIAAGEEPKMNDAFHTFKFCLIFLILSLFIWWLSMFF